MAQTDDIQDRVLVARVLADECRTWRAETRWRVKRDDPARKARLEELLSAIDAAMKPIRSHIGRLVWEPIPEAEEIVLRNASSELQYERRQLKKMR